MQHRLAPARSAVGARPSAPPTGRRTAAPAPWSDDAPRAGAALAPPTGGADGRSRTAGVAASRALLAWTLDLQLWCLGRDILHPDGNALLRYGFARTRPPTGATGSSRYDLAPPAGAADAPTLSLWGFGLAVSPLAWAGVPAGALVLGRHAGLAAPLLGVTPGPLEDGPLWLASQLPPRCPPGCAADRGGAAAGLAWLAGYLGAYEAWVRATLGAAHRDRCVAERPRAVRRRQERLQARLARTRAGYPDASGWGSTEPGVQTLGLVWQRIAAAHAASPGAALGGGPPPA